MYTVFRHQEIPNLLPATVIFTLSDFPNPSFNYRVYLSLLPFSFLSLLVLIQKAQKTQSFDTCNPQVNSLTMFAQGDPKAFAVGDCPCAMTYAGEKVEKCMSFGTLLEIRKSSGRPIHYLDLEEAKAKLVELDRKGYVHTTNAMGRILDRCYVVQLCNCSAGTCSRLRMRDQGHPYTSKGHYIAAVNPLTCSGCRRCLAYCQYGALRFDPTNRKAWVDVRVCQGCGVCRIQCDSEAISLLDRAKVPAAANLW